MDFAETSKIKEQFRAGHWPQFVERIEISNLRGWKGESVNFDYPVVAIVGENGTGKSTLLKVAACAYEHPSEKNKTFYPSTFFLNTQWETVQDVSLRFRVKIGNNSREYTISKRSKKWSLPDSRLKRNVFIFDISRTLPLDASVGYAKLAKLASQEVAADDIAPEYLEELSRILSRDYRSARFVTTDVPGNKRVGVLTRDFGDNSQFHQGAGEDTTLDLFEVLQSIPEYSLLIIDEVEASLHPKAQRRLIRFLLKFSRKKRIQIVLSTHSPYVLEELPPEGRILLLKGKDHVNVVYGVSPELALSRIDDSNYPELFLFCEDAPSVAWTREILKRSEGADNLLPRVSFVAAGASNVVAMLGQLASENKLPYKSFGVLDGDVAGQNAPGCLFLPGDSAPERVVFLALKDINWEGTVERFGMGAGHLYEILDDACRLPDHHEWPSYVGDKLLMPARSVWEILVALWCDKFLSPEFLDEFSAYVLHKLNNQR
jgi:predicted ATPase